MSKVESDKSPFKLTIVASSDIHGVVMPIQYADNSIQELGLAKLATIIRRVRESNPNMLLIDNGDLIQGTPFAYVYARVQQEPMHPLVHCLNELKYDAAVVGNHEFNYGLDVLGKVVGNSHFPWLSANTVRATDGEPYFGPPYIVKSFPNGPRVGILGLTTQFIPNWELPSHIKGLQFKDAWTTAEYWVQYMREQEEVDVVVVAYHGGLERDLATGQLSEADTGENQGYRICRDIQGIDVLLTGHQHQKITDQIHGVTVVQPGVQGTHLAQVELEMEREEGGDGWSIVSKKAQLLSAEGVPADSAIMDMMSTYEATTQHWLDQPIGKMNGEMRIADPMKARLEEHPFIEFIHRVQMHYGQADISCASLFDNTAPGFSSDITMREVVANYIYPNTLRVIRVAGQDIKDALEQSACYFTLSDDGEVLVNYSFLHPKPQHYNYDMWEGIEYELNLSYPEGQRVTRLEYQGQPLDLIKEYHVVMNNYRAGGGGPYPMFAGKPIIRDVPTEMAELMVNYIVERGTIEKSVNHNWRVITETY